MMASTGLRNLVLGGSPPVSLSLQAGPIAHIWVTTIYHNEYIVGNRWEAHPPYQGVPSYKNIMDMDTGEQKVGSFAGLRHPPIYKEGN